MIQPNDIATQVIWTLNSPSQGKGRIYADEKYSFKNAAKVETVNEVGSPDPVGFITVPGNKTVSLDLHLTKGDQTTQFDYDLMEVTEEQVSLTMQIVGGRRYQLLPARVYVTGRDGDSEAKHSIAVDFVGLQWLPL